MYIKSHVQTQCLNNKELQSKLLENCGSLPGWAKYRRSLHFRAETANDAACAVLRVCRR